MISVFIRTYHGDLAWLKYCLASVHRNLRGWAEIVVCIREGQEALLEGIITTERVVTCPRYPDDYIGQQISKLQAFRHVRGDYVLFVDSDLVFHPGASVADYLAGDRPVLLKESYARLIVKHPDIDIRRWQLAVENLFGSRPSHEYMRRAPQLLRTSTLRALDETFPYLEAHAVCQRDRLFSEFNALGFFVELCEAEQYSIIDLERHAAPPNPATQFWSWGGISPEILMKLADLGVRDPGEPTTQPAPLPITAPPKLGKWRRLRYALQKYFPDLV